MTLLFFHAIVFELEEGARNLIKGRGVSFRKARRGEPSNGKRQRPMLSGRPTAKGRNAHGDDSDLIR
jgi:hypothetical protein